MKAKEKKELREKTVPELHVFLAQALERQKTDRFEAIRGKLKNTSSLLHKRKDIARISSILREKELLHENA